MAPLDLMSAGSVQSIVKEVAYGEARADVRRMSTVTPQSSLNVTYAQVQPSVPRPRAHSCDWPSE